MSHGTQKKRVAGARRKGFDPLWFNEGGAWELIHIGESKFEKPTIFLSWYHKRPKYFIKYDLLNLVNLHKRH
jgi:hypothetical protein